ncbi:conserved hypothetical protein [Methylomarinovum caldicuralii]|uniref:SSD domain-containing protein n=1 Tax=Methylomarinovum caldicuralii TaxID=438856 RepID=A0AAU9C6H2_9GAMM|nr:MMPL family transporter [Methylomarinovum caldicuralii]BCX81539.1 conserved hypothetical protein [Methylomarinovum caldicuralii]
MIPTRLDRVLSIARWSQRHPLWTLALLFLAAALSGLYAATHLEVNTDTDKMLNPKLPFMQKRFELERLFPQDKRAILLMVESPVPEVSEAAARRLKALLSPHKDTIASVYLPTAHPFFDRYGLLYLDTPKLERLANDLARAQPFIARLYEDFSLGSLLRLLVKALQHQTEMPVKLDPVAGRLATAIEAQLENRPYLLSWSDLLFQPEREIGHTLHFVVVSPVLDFERMLPAEKTIATILGAIAQVRTLDGIPVRVRMTGEPVLEYEEMLSITHGTEVAGLVSLVLVCLALLLSFRSWKLALATLITLVLGLLFSMGFAAVSVGSLNMISIAFAVLYIGMGVDYATHLALRYREYLLEDRTPGEALWHSVKSVSPALLLCALTTALALYAFIPTPYQGISELGLIAGSSMFIVVFVTLTAMPALLSLMHLEAVSHWRRRRTLFLSPQLAQFPYRHSSGIKRLTFFLALAALGALCAIRVDFNPINLRDPNSESVKTFKELLQRKEASPMFLTALAENPAETRLLEQRFEQFPVVEAAVSIFDLIPQDQEDKLAVIDEIALILGPQLEQPLDARGGQTRLEDLENFQAELARPAATKALAPETRARLETALDRFLSVCRRLDAADCRRQIEQLQFRVLATFPRVMEKLRLGLTAAPLESDDLPEDIRSRWISPSGIYRIDVLPAKDMNVLDNMREFVHEVRNAYPDITGLPVIYIESMAVIIASFKQAFASAVVLISGLLLLLLRNGRDTFLVLLPLGLGALLTGAAMAVLDLPFNYANVIVLPLLFGLGVDNGIHMIHRMHQLPTGDSILTTSTARGIFFSALTTLFSFASLGFVSHAGIASIGQLLTVGLILNLLCTFFVLPAFAATTAETRP